MNETLRKYGVLAIMILLAGYYGLLAYFSEGTIGGADDITHYRYARYAFHYPEFLLHHWGKPLFTLLAAPFAQAGHTGIRLFNVLAGLATAWLTYRTALLLRHRYALLALFLVLSSPLYSMLMLSGMTEILGSFLLVLSIFLFFKDKAVLSAIVLSFMPFVRNEAVVLIPLFAAGFIVLHRTKALPFLLTGFVVYSIVGSFHFGDLWWVIRQMPYTGEAREMYGSGSLLHYVEETRLTVGLPMAFAATAGALLWLLDGWEGLLPGSGRSADRTGLPRQRWLELLVGYLPFFVYLAAHSYVWWRGIGNSVGMIRVITAVVPSLALLASFGWSRLMDLLPAWRIPKAVATVLAAAGLLIVPHTLYTLPVPLLEYRPAVKEAARWILDSEYSGEKIIYYDPFFPHYMDLNPYDSTRFRAFLPNAAQPGYGVEEGTLLIWDAMFSPTSGQLPLERLLDHPGYRAIEDFRPEKNFRVMGQWDYSIHIFQRVPEPPVRRSDGDIMREQD